MVVPLTGMVWLGKRINQVARISGSVTVPDVFRDRFQSPALGILASVLILIFLCFNLVVQFKAGGVVMQEAIRLPPADAIYRGAEVDPEHILVLAFETPEGKTLKPQKTPLPTRKAEFLPERTKVDGTNREVRVSFRHDGKITEKKVRFPPQRVAIPWLDEGPEKGYLIGLLIFALTVVAYTTYGGFWAVTWTDVLEGLVMLVGVVVMAILALRAVEPITSGGKELTGLAAATERLRQQDPQLVYGPGPEGVSPPIGHGYLPLGMAFSFFLMWSFGGAGQPSGMVRLMSFKDTPSFRRALVLIGVYYFLAYVSLLIIFICARAIFPTEYLREIGSEGNPDSIMPAMARHLAHPLVAGLLLAAPYAAIMSTVAAFLLMISSSLVRDLYQRTINPNASPKTLKRVSYLTTALVGVVVMLGAINPPGFLQYVIVFTGSGQTCAFLFPMVCTLYWRRATRQGIWAGMLGGGLTVMLLYVLGWIDTAYQKAGATGPAWLSWFPGWGEKREEAFAPLYAGGCDPLIWGLLASLILTVVVSLRTKPDPESVRKYFP
ncbi:MAG TPA: hypothetical protein VEL76_35980, partial [Gemmataceae bacterium]|nr:hypothetical protein [Gemmataceae bacterium]